MRRILTVLLLCCTLPAFAQADRHDVRAGNRKFRQERFKEAEIDYRKAALKDSLSVTAEYNLASALYRQQDYVGAAKALATVKEQEALPAQYHFNAGDAALQQKDYAAAVQAFRQALLLDPADLDAKENYIYAKKMLENQQQGGDDDKQDQNQQDQQKQEQEDQNQQNQQNQKEEQQPPKDKDRQDQQPQISPQQAQQMLRAIQAKERETQDKVNEEKAALLKSRQKEKNW